MAQVKVFNFMRISFTILVICLHWSMAQQQDWTHETNACISGHNNLVLDGIFTLSDCKARCEDEPGFFCRSVEYHSNSNRCALSEATSSSSSYKPQCPSSGWEFTEKLAATTCAGGWLVGDVWEDSCGSRHECMATGKIMIVGGEIIECVSGDTWQDKDGANTLHCICYGNHKLCLDFEPAGYLEKSCGGQSTECEHGVTWTEKVGNDILHGVCIHGFKECLDFKLTRPLRCVGFEEWTEYSGGCAYCFDGQFSSTGPCPLICASFQFGAGELAPRIPAHLNDCKVIKGGELDHAHYNEKCRKCEHCDEPCHIFNARTCNCRRRPFCKN